MRSPNQIRTISSMVEQEIKAPIHALPIDPTIVIPIAFTLIVFLFGWGWWITKRSLDQEIETKEEISRLLQKLATEHVRGEEFHELRAEVSSGFAEIRTLIMQLAVKRRDSSEPRDS